jgi:Tol biopolymer transport system component
LLGAPSRDGRYLSHVDAATHNLALRDLALGRSRLLTARAAESGEFAYFSIPSPDARRVAYAWFNDEGFYDLRVTDRDSGTPRVLYRNEEAGFVQPCAWTPDGKFILTLLFRTDNISQIALAPAEGGPPKVLRSLNWVYPKRMDVSPDGRFIVYDSFADDSGTSRTVFLLAVDGARERRLVTLPGNHLFPLWMPDGKAIVYAGDRAGAMDIWMLPMQDGEPRGEPRLVRRDVGRILPLGVTQDRNFYYGLRTGSVDVFVMKAGEPAREARRATLRFPGRNSAPAWSHDGSALAYLSRRGSENFGQESRAIVIRRLDPDEERELLPKLAHLERLRWSPDGKTLLVSGSDGKGRAGLFLVDAATAAVRPLVAEPGVPFRGFEGVWSRDGRTVFYLHGDRELRAREVESGAERTVYRGAGLRHLAVSPDGKSLAVGVGGRSIARIPAAGGEPVLIPFEGLTELEWGRDLVAGRGPEMWRLPNEGSPPAKLPSPGNRDAGFSLHPDGERLALTAGSVKSEVWVLPLR